MMSDPLYIQNSVDNNSSGIYVSTEIGDSYSSNACPHKSDCDDSSLMYGVGIGYEIGKFAFDFKYNAITPKYRKINSEETSISTSEMYIGMRYKVWDEDNLAVSLGGGLGHWSSLHTGNNSIITGIGTYNQSGISPSLMGDIGYSVNKYIEPYITLRAIKGFSSSENNEYIGTVGIRFRFGETSQLINHNTTIVNNYTQAPGVGYLELDFARDAGVPTAQSIQALSNSFDESFDGCVTIIAHASQTGRKKYNEKLSAKRAQFIEDFIVDKSPKIKNKHIFKEYRLGSLFPIYKDNTSNRRAQIFFSENKMWCEK
jgi:hypothetical protein